MCARANFAERPRALPKRPLTDAYDNKFGATIEGDVGGTSDTPVIIDSIMYTDTGEVINYHE